MLRTDRRPDLADRLEPARERLAHAGDRAREGAEVARDRVAEGAEVARERIAEVAEQVEPTVSRSASAAASAGRSALAVASTLPSLLSKLLGLLSVLSASLAERGREVAARVEPPKAERRRSTLRTAAWFGGGFGVGVAAGWVLHARMQEPAHEADDGYGHAPAESPYGADAAAIDARRENAPTS